MSSSSATDYSPEITPLDSLISRQDSRSYWLNVEANIRGMTGGDLESSDTDLEGSAAFLRSLGFVISDCPLHKAGRVLEGGAGIGRVTLAVLVKVAQVVDVVEPIAKFTALLEGKPGIGHIFNVGIEDWNPVSGLKYDLIWNQWCATHLTDAQLVNYLCVCRSVLNLGKGVVVFKENITRGKDHVFDHADSSVTRSDNKFRAIFHRAGFLVVGAQLQAGFPKNFYQIMMYALQPANVKAEGESKA